MTGTSYAAKATRKEHSVRGCQALRCSRAAAKAAAESGGTMRAARRFALSVALLVPVSVSGSALAATAAHAAAAPAIVITSPVAGSTVTDLIGIGVTSTTDPASGDYPL